MSMREKNTKRIRYQKNRPYRMNPRSRSAQPRTEFPGCDVVRLSLWLLFYELGNGSQLVYESGVHRTHGKRNMVT